MSDFTLLNWLAVNSYMRDDYRLLVAMMAVRKISDAPEQLQTLARNAFSAIHVPGARSFFRAHVIEQRKALAKAMQSEPQVAALVIALWSHAADAQIQLMKQAGAMAGLEFSEEWNWQKGMEGFFDFEDIPVIYSLAEKLGEHASTQDADHLKLAALWLAPAVTNRDALAAPAMQETAESEAETLDSDADERG